jgi:23S rRNA pseudouridine1911/1915/1917 synthase
MIINKHIVPPNIEKTRLSDYAVGLFSTVPTRKGIKKAIKKGAILVNEKVGFSGDWIEGGEEISLIDLQESTHKVFECALPIVFEDEDLAIINKPGGIAVSGNFYKTVQNALVFNLKPSNAIDALKIPRPVHRLDAATCGLLLIAKTKSAQLHLSQQFEHKTIKKRYQAIAIGKLPAAGKFEMPIDEKRSITDFKTVKIVPSLKNEFLTLVDLFPITGRTHQLRKHLAGNDTPILGDKLYFKEGLVLFKKGLFLCAVELQLTHPKTGELLKITIEPPNKFNAILEREARNFRHIAT